MGVPSRAYVGILTFALLASLAIVPYTVLILAGYQPPPEAPHELLFPDAGDAVQPGTKVVLSVASLFCLALVVASWRGLLASARRDAQRRQERQTHRDGPGSVDATPAPPVLVVEEQPPGYQ